MRLEAEGTTTQVDIEECTQLVEIAEWFDWLSMRAASGDVVMPGAEDAVLTIVRAIDFAEEISGMVLEFPEDLRIQTIEAAIVFQCRLQERNQPKAGPQLLRVQ